MRGLAELWQRVVPRTWQRRMRQYACRRHRPKATFVVYASAARQWLAWSQQSTVQLEMSVQECNWELPSLSHPSSLGMRYTFTFFRPYLDISNPMAGLESREFLQRVAHRYRNKSRRPLILYTGSQRAVKGALSAEASGFHWQLSDGLQNATDRTDFVVATISDHSPYIRAWCWEDGQLVPLSVRIVDDAIRKQPFPRPEDWWKTLYH